MARKSKVVEKLKSMSRNKFGRVDVKMFLEHCANTGVSLRELGRRIGASPEGMRKVADKYGVEFKQYPAAVRMEYNLKRMGFETSEQYFLNRSISDFGAMAEELDVSVAFVRERYGELLQSVQVPNRSDHAEAREG